MHPYLLLKCDLLIKKLACFFKEKKLLKNFTHHMCSFFGEYHNLFSVCSCTACIAWKNALLLLLSLG